MRKNTPRSLLVLTLLATIVTVAYAGGWSIITLNDFPDHAVAGEPLNLTFTVRQHGNNPVDGLKPSIQATKNGAGTISAAAQATPKPGQYAAILRLPAPGDWTIRIDGGFNPEDKTRSYNSMVLPPLKVVQHASMTPAPLTAAERGSRLFIAKGCVGCHGAGSERDLSGRQFAADYLKKVLADPSIRTADMPNLKLNETEISALSAFITGRSSNKKG